MKPIRRTPALLLSIMVSVSLVLTGCTAAVNTDESQITAAAAASPEAAVLQAPQAEQTPQAIQTQDASEQLSYVSIDVNPSVRLTLKDGVVLQAQAFNDDGEELLLENDVAGLTPQEALQTLIAAFADGGYILSEGEQAALVITACGDKSEELIASLEHTATQSLTELGLTCNVRVSTVTNSIVDEAKASGLTPGKYLALTYLADEDGLTLDEAKEKYGSLKMGKLVKLLDDVDTVFGHKGDDGKLQNLAGSGILTPEQEQLLAQAQNKFKVAMQQAQEAFKQLKAQTRELWQNSKTEIQNAFKSDKDVQKWKSTKDALKAQIEQQKQTAVEAFKQAKVQAQEQFKAAVQSLGLSDEQIAALIDWSFDYDWDFDFDWSYGDNTDEAGGPHGNVQEEAGGPHDNVQVEAGGNKDEVSPEENGSNDNIDKPAGNTSDEEKPSKTSNGKKS